MSDTAECKCLVEADTGTPWRRFGPYLSDRQWGTVREDYSSDGDAWTYLPHEPAVAKATEAQRFVTEELKKAFAPPSNAAVALREMGVAPYPQAPNPVVDPQPSTAPGEGATTQGKQPGPSRGCR